MAYVPLADQDHEMEMHHPHSFVEKYVWSQDHKVIAIQYGGLAVFTGIVGLVLSLLFRMQLGFPDTASFNRYMAAEYHTSMSPKVMAMLDGDPVFEDLEALS